jgi:hypothetical protein
LRKSIPPPEKQMKKSVRTSKSKLTKEIDEKRKRCIRENDSAFNPPLPLSAKKEGAKWHR